MESMRRNFDGHLSRTGRRVKVFPGRCEEALHFYGQALGTETEMMM